MYVQPSRRVTCKARKIDARKTAWKEWKVETWNNSQGAQMLQRYLFLSMILWFDVFLHSLSAAKIKSGEMWPYFWYFDCTLGSRTLRFSTHTTFATCKSESLNCQPESCKKLHCCFTCIKPATLLLRGDLSDIIYLWKALHWVCPPAMLLLVVLHPIVTLEPTLATT